MNISIRVKKNLKPLVVICAVASVSGGIFNLLTVEKSFGPFAQGALDAFVISLLLGSYTLYIAQGYLINFFRHLNFTVALLINSAVYVFLILGGRFVGNYMTNPDDAFIKGVFFGENFNQAMVLAFSLSFTFNFILQMNRLVGQNVLFNFVSGTYHKPRDEERIFMFLDLESSTGITEKLGDRKFHSLLNKFFYDVTDAVLETDGEIYEYVGDEVVISWKHAKGVKNSNCLHCFFLIKNQIAQYSKKYLQEFDCVPEFRAGLHGGSVVAGELGDVRQKIGFVGDVLNSTSRLRDYCREKNRRFLVSDRIIDAIHIPEKFVEEDMGDFQPRGKQQSFRIYSVAEKP
jgi:adenylate cyclase